MKNLTIIICLFSLLNLQAQTRQKITINTNWKFHKGEISESSGENQWENVNIPHTWNAHDVLDDKPGIYTGVCWYKKKLFIPEHMQQKQLYIYFEGANQDATVFINDTEVGQHFGGYTAFCFNITDFVNPEKENILSVKLDNSLNPDVPPVGGDMERFGGIYRDVYLISLNDIHFDIGFFASSGVFVTTPKVDGKSAEIIIKSKIYNADNQKLNVVHSLVNQKGTNVQSVSTRTKSKTAESKMKLEKPELWGPDNPILYTLKSQIINKKGEILDEIFQQIGFRGLGADKDKGILLNGEPIFIKGIGKHQDYDKLGYAVPNEILRNDVVLLKKMGANLLRSHYPLDPITYDACDELGVMAWGKIPIMDKVNHTPEFMKNTKNMMQEVMYQNYNRPSFILWGFACEIFGDMDWYWPKPQDPEKVKENLKQTEAFSNEMEQFMREINPYRLTANDFHTDPTPEFYKKANQTSLQMVNGWNLYQGWYHNNLDSIDWAFKTFRAYNPEVPFLIAEFGAGSDTRLHAYEPTIFDFTTEYQDIFHEAYLNKVKNYDFVHGMCIWTLVDFQVAKRADAVPHINSKGMLRADRTPKDSYYLYQANWSKKPMVHIAARDWTKRKELVEGNTATRPIRIYSNQPEVELFLNGKTLGSKKIKQHIATWNVPFTEGENHLFAKAPHPSGHIVDHLDINFTFIPKDLQNSEFPKDGLCINAGQSRTFFIDDLTGNIWMPDKQFDKGNYGHQKGEYHRSWPHMQAWEGIREGVGQNIKGTAIDPVYQTFLTGIDEYTIDVPKGSYTITLLFAEPFGTKAGERVFDVKVNGQVVFKELDLAKQFGNSVAVERSAEIAADENGIRIILSPVTGETVLNGIMLERTKN
jgi:beta-galactosidase